MSVARRRPAMAQSGMPDTEFAAAARTLAARIVALAQAGPHQEPIWTGDDIDPASFVDLDTPPSLIHGRLDNGLLTGRAGIAVALSACSGLPGAPASWPSVAIGGARAAVRESAAAIASGAPSASLGWDSGALGIARGAAVVATTLGDAPLLAEARELTGIALHRILEAQEQLPPWADLLGGVAGVLVAALSAPRDPGADALLDEAVEMLVERVDTLSVPASLGRRWIMATADHSVVGLAHGATGIALALNFAARHLRSRVEPEPRPRLARRASRERIAERADELAAAGVLWEECLYDASAGGWPDLRVADRAPGLAWCHGAPGVGVGATLRHAAVRVDSLGGTARDEASTYVAFGRARAASAAHQPVGDRPFDGTMCHGLAGVVEMHLLAAEVWPDAAAEHLRSARALATSLTRAGQSARPAWHCGLPDGGRTPNLLFGIGGVALTLARCHDPALSPSAADPTLGRIQQVVA